MDELLTQEVFDCAWRYCCRCTISRQDAEDLMQDSLFLAFRRLPQLRDSGSFRNWLLSIIRRRHIDGQRKRRLDARLQTGLQYAATPGGGVMAAQHYEISGDCPASRALAVALEFLPRDQRNLLCLHYIEDLPVPDLAAIHNCSRGAIEQRLHRSRKALRAALGSMVVSGNRHDLRSET